MGAVLVLGGTAWLGREVARAALEHGHEVTCLARGDAGEVAAGARLVRADRTATGAYDDVRAGVWDDVVDVSWQPGQVRSALDALAGGAAHWTYVSSCSVYAAADEPGADESAALLDPWTADTATTQEYGGAKVACERLVTAAVGPGALLVRAGLIGGPGDPSDRFGYWVGRFALAAAGEVLVPGSPDQPTQTVDVRDLADWIVRAGERGAGGPVNAVGADHALGDVLGAARRVAGGSATAVPADPGWLLEHEVTGWAGPRSLPLWLPWPDHAGFGARSGTLAASLGLAHRPLDQVLGDVLLDERQRGLDRERRAGLARGDELALLALLAQG